MIDTGCNLMAQMTVRMFTVLFTLVMLGCSGNPSLNGLKAGGGGALANVSVAEFGDAPAPTAPLTLDKSATDPGIGKYDFSVEEVQFRESSSFLFKAQAPSVRIVAKNRGYAPVSVTITFMRDL